MILGISNTIMGDLSKKTYMCHVDHIGIPLQQHLFYGEKHTVFGGIYQKTPFEPLIILINYFMLAFWKILSVPMVSNCNITNMEDQKMDLQKFPNHIETKVSKLGV